jgi:hypothetical protein
MSRVDLGLTLLIALVAAIAAVSVMTVRYARYRDAVARGRRHLKPIRRPFWMQ